MITIFINLLQIFSKKSKSFLKNYEKLTKKLFEIENKWKSLVMVVVVVLAKCCDFIDRSEVHFFQNSLKI